MQTPSDQMSVRWSTVFGLRTCSGDMYGGEPSTARAPVSCCVCRSGAASCDLEMPKSRTLITSVPSGFLVRKRFEGFRSRWMIPRPCACARPSSAWRT